MPELENFFVKDEINLHQARFVCMDTTNVNSGKKNGLKRHLEHKVPLLKWIGCNNHKLALTFKHLIPAFQCVVETNIFLLNLWKYFKYHPLAIFEEIPVKCMVIALLSNHCNKFDARYVLKSIKLLMLFFQMSKGACSVSDASTYYELCPESLKYLKEKSNYCNS